MVINCPLCILYFMMLSQIWKRCNINTCLEMSRLFQTCVTPLCWVKVQRCKIKSPSPDFLNLTRWSDDAYTNLLFNQSSYDHKMLNNTSDLKYPLKMITNKEFQATKEMVLNSTHFVHGDISLYSSRWRHPNPASPTHQPPPPAGLVLDRPVAISPSRL